MREDRYMNPNATESNRVRRSFWRSFFLVLGAFLLGGLVLPNLRITWREPDSMAQSAVGLGVAPGQPQQALSEAESYARAAQTAGPAVVNIDMRRRVRVAPGFFDEDWMMGPRFREAASEGSGVIINKNGDILTNEHVVGAAGEANKKILVTLQDGRKFDGVVIGSDHATDVALVHIQGENLPVAKLGTVRGLIPGQMAVAIGNPFGLRFTVTHGVISALDRPVPVEDRVYERLIQTDCAINPGNSGGALVNLKGEVIGINTVVLSSAQGIGFAIPIDTALRVAEELKRYGRVKRPWFGVIVITNTTRLAEYYGLPNAAGVVVARLYRGGPGESAGVQPGDILTKINGQPVRTEEEFKTIEKKLRIGQKVDVELLRGSQKGTGRITVGEAP